MIANRAQCIMSALSAGAGVIHLAIIGPHFEESVLYGFFFLVVAAFQLVWAGLILGRSDRWVLAVGSAVNLVVILVWLLSRTVGVPLGPGAGHPEPVALADVVASGFEVLLVIGALILLRSRSLLRALPLAALWGVGLISLILTSVAVLGGFGAAPAYAHHDQTSQDLQRDEQSAQHAPGSHQGETVEP